MAAGKADLAGLLPPSTDELIKKWLEEDIPTFDVGGYVVGDRPEKAFLLGKSEGIMAGKPFFDAVFKHVGCTVTWHVEEGVEVKPVMHMATVEGPCRNLLMGERLALNIMTRASGIATQAKVVADIAAKAGWHGQVVGTRKVTPGFRLVEKYALLVGGAGTHRMDLSSMIMLKDNHVWSAGSITAAVEKAKSVAGFPIKIEVETRDLDEAREAAKAGADIVMLDNYTPERLAEDGAILKREFPHLLIEVSGGITPDTLAPYCLPESDIISMGRLTQGYPALDFSLKLAKGASKPGGTTIRTVAEGAAGGGAAGPA